MRRKSRGERRTCEGWRERGRTACCPTPLAPQLGARSHSATASPTPLALGRLRPCPPKLDARGAGAVTGPRLHHEREYFL